MISIGEMERGVLNMKNGFNDSTIPWVQPDMKGFDFRTAPEYIASQTDVEAYQRDGVVVIRGAFEDWVPELSNGLARNIDNPQAYRFPCESNPTGAPGRFFDSYCNWDLIPEDGMSYWVPRDRSFILRDGIEGYRVFRANGEGFFAQIAFVSPGTNTYRDLVEVGPELYRYVVVASDMDNWRAPNILRGSSDDFARQVSMVVIRQDENGSKIRGLFDNDLDVDLDDFFLFVDVFGTRVFTPEFSGKFDLDRDGVVDLDDFFIFADDFGRQARDVEF